MSRRIIKGIFLTRHGLDKFRSIRSKFIGIQFLSILLTVTLVCGFSLKAVSQYYSDTQQNKLEALSQSLAIETRHVLGQLKFQLSRLETHDFHRFYRIGILFETFNEHSTWFPQLAYFDEEGEQLVNVNSGQLMSGLLQPLSGELLERVLDNPNQVHISVLSGADSIEPSVQLTQARVGYFGDEFQGILQATIPLSYFSEMFSSRSPGADVELILTDQLGRILMHPDPARVLSPLLSAGQELTMMLPVAGNILNQQTIDGVPSHYSYQLLLDPAWYVFAVAPVSVLDNLMRELLQINLGLALVGLLAGLLMAQLLVRPIVSNIGRINKQARNLAEGRLDQRIEVVSRDELSELANSVNRLTEKLQHASAAHESLDLMLQAVADPLVICDRSGAVLRTNAAAQDLFAWSADEFSGQPLSRYFSRRSPLAKRELLQEMLHQPQLKNYETEVLVADGALLPVNFSFAHAYDESNEVRFIVCLFRDISLQKEAETEISRLAYYDSLTGLPNRSLLHDRLQMTIRHAERSIGGYKRFAVMFLDLDHFKNVNDTLGHSIGDQLLKSAADRLQSCLREADTVSRTVAEAEGLYEGEEHVLARLGGDEFIILLPMLRTPEDAGMVARQIIDDMARPFVIEGHEVVTPASIGLAVYPDDGTDGESLMRCADIAMYHAKEQGRNSFYYFSEEMNEAARERLRLEHQLRNDIEKRQNIYLVYQPKIDTRTSRMLGIELLARWQHPELGEVSPNRFIPIAEDSGLIVPLGKWILEMGCHQLQEWIRQGRPYCQIAVNLSGRQLKQPDLLAMLAGVLQESGLDPALLELELTESMLMETVDKTILLLQQLKRLGVTLAIDDFGTGYSSLSYLKRFPIDTLKIDQSFVRDIESDRDDAAIIEAIIAMAQTLKLKVVAEGVETELQFEFLKEKGADQCQGFLFGKPVTAEKFAELYL